VNRPTREEQRDRLLEAALVHVPFDGWSRRSLLAGARDAGIDPALARRLFPRGGDDLLAHLDAWADRKMLEQLDPAVLQGLRMRERIAALVRARLEVLGPHREAMRRAVAARLLPGNAITGGGNLWRTVDVIWQAAGDRGADFSYYTKRALLAAVVSSTFLYWLEDRSPGSIDSWAFLERRIDDVMQLGGAGKRFEDLLGGLSRLNPLRSGR
jgi:ubiquinone biosynthesis protein COQ9